MTDFMWRLAVRTRNFARRHGLLGRLEIPLVRLAVRLLPPPATDVTTVVHGRLTMTAPAGTPSARTYAACLYEPDTTELISSKLKAGMTFVDAGANLGYYSLLAASIVGAGGHVFAFEPDHRNFAYLRLNLDSNGIRNVTAINAALSSSDATVYFVPDPHGAEGVVHPIPVRGASPVPGVSLDAFFHARGWPVVDFIKMDIEGSEPAALDGMRELSDRNPGLQLVLEVSDRAMLRAGSASTNLLELLQELGFSDGRIVESQQATFSLGNGLPRIAGTYNLYVWKRPVAGGSPAAGHCQQ